MVPLALCAYLPTTNYVILSESRIRKELYLHHIENRPPLTESSERIFFFFFMAHGYKGCEIMGRKYLHRRKVMFSTAFTPSFYYPSLSALFFFFGCSGRVFICPFIWQNTNCHFKSNYELLKVSSDGKTFTTWILCRIL